MAAPMWTGGAMQFGDWAPWIWAIMSDWAKQPFYPDDPPKDPGAFTAQAMVICSYPIVGTIYSPFIIQYCVYYQEQWDANPPGSYSSTPELPTMPATPDPNLSQTNDWLGRFNALWADVIYAGNEAHEAHLAADLILDRLPQGEDPPPLTTESDTARILAAIYYTNWLWYNNPPPVSVPDVLQAITDAHGITDGKIDAVDLNVDGFATNTQNAFLALTELVDNVSGDIDVIDGIADSILAWTAAYEEPTVQPTGYPGNAGVTWGTPVGFTDPIRVDVAMDGCLVDIDSMPAGTGKHTVGGVDSWQHAGWLAFLADDGKADELQWLNLESAVYVPKRLAAATGVLLFPRANSSGTLTPWTRTS